jgi:hypothetical protein
LAAVTKHFFIVEVEDAEFLAGDLFRRVFGSDPPTYPRHFVCLHRADDGVMRTAGYVHFSAFESMHLVGGLVSEKSLYRIIPAAHRTELPHESIAEFLMGEGVARLIGSNGVFAIIGDARSVEVNRNVGYVPTHVPKLYALWKRDFPDDVKRAAAERVMRIAPF